jgi:hypothetical protein
VAAADMLTDMRRYKTRAFLRRGNREQGPATSRTGRSCSTHLDSEPRRPYAHLARGTRQVVHMPYIKSPESAKELFDPCFSPGS